MQRAGMGEGGGRVRERERGSSSSKEGGPRVELQLRHAKLHSPLTVRPSEMTSNPKSQSRQTSELSFHYRLPSQFPIPSSQFPSCPIISGAGRRCWCLPSISNGAVAGWSPTVTSATVDGQASVPV